MIEVEVEARRYKQKLKSTTTRRALIDAAVDVIVERGFSDTTTTLIADRAHVSRGALQHHFKSKNDIIVAVLDEINQEANLRIDVDQLVKKTTAERIDILLDHLFDVYDTKLHRAAIQIWLSVFSDSLLHERVRHDFSRMEVSINSVWAQVFPEQKLSHTRVAAIRHVVINSIRGTTMRRMLKIYDGDAGSEIAILREFLIGVLTPSGNAAGASGRVRGGLDKSSTQNPARRK
jgi:AcrR family transcriptional regulator